MSAHDPSTIDASRPKWVRALFVIYGLMAYGMFLGTFLYFIGFLSGAVVPKGINDGTVVPLGEALLVNAGILGLFAVQHTVMARIAFKRWWTRFVPTPIERATFVAITCGIVATLCWQWRPLPGLVWEVDGIAARTVLWLIAATGWTTVLLSTFWIDHFDLFGLRQVFRAWHGRAHGHHPFTTRGLYRHVRHPLMLGFLIAFWATPSMSQGQLLFALLCTGYILLGVRIEERTLVQILGRDYVRYQQSTPMLIPGPRRTEKETVAVELVDR